MKKVLFIMFIAMVFVACNKNQKVANNLSETWHATSYVQTDFFGSFDQVTNGTLDITFTFDACKLEDKTDCILNWTTKLNADGSLYERSYAYSIIADGDSLILTSDESSTFNMEFAIVTMDKNNLALKSGTADEILREWLFVKD